MTATCIICAQPFTRRHPAHKTCSPQCSRRRANRSDDYHRHKRNKRRAVERWTDITPGQEAEMRRRARKCPLCGIRMTSDRYKPNSKELDHIVPIGVGGTHTHGNVRIICRTCNLKRPKDGSDYTGPVTLWAQVPDVMMPQPKPRPVPKPPRILKGLPVATCACGAQFGQHSARQARCHDCIVGIATRAAELRSQGVPWKEVASAVGYPNLGSLHTIAVQYGGYDYKTDRRRIRSNLYNAGLS